MAMSDQLFASILAMDAYNRGYGAQLKLSGGGTSDAVGTSLGNATIIGSDGFDAAQAVDFYAVAYSWNGQKVISFRGTDDPAFLSFAGDFWNGWVGGAGFITTQAARAEAFYQSVTGSSVAGGTVGNVLLTGHSLGGGLAGYIAALTGDKADIFDSMPYGAAAMQRYIAENVAAGITDIASLFTGNPTASFAPFPNAFGITAEYTSGEVLTAVRALGIPAAFLTANPSAVAAAAVLPLEQTDLAPLSANAGGITDAVSLHSIALLVLLQYAKDNGLTDWQQVAPNLFKAYLDDSIGSALGLVQGQTGTGLASPSGQMLDAIAYSAIDTGTLVFGDTGIRSLFNDAGDLGRMFASGAAPSPCLADSHVRTDLADIDVEYAGLLALNHDATDAHTSGVITYDPDLKSLDIDLSSTVWDAGAKPPSAIVGKEDLISAALSSLPRAPDPSSISPKIGHVVIAASNSGAVLTATGPLAASEGVLLVGGSGNDTMTGSSGDDILIGNGGSDVMDGGAGIDTAYFSETGTAYDITPAQNDSLSVGSDTLTGIERLEFGGNDTITMASDLVSPDLLTVDGGGGNNTIHAGNGDKTVYYGGSYGTNTLYGYSEFDPAAVSRLVGGPSDEDLAQQQTDPSLPSLGTPGACDVTIHSGLSCAIMVGGPGTNHFISDIPRYATDAIPDVPTQVIWGGGGTSTYEVHGGEVQIYQMADPTADKVANLDFHGLAWDQKNYPDIPETVAAQEAVLAREYPATYGATLGSLDNDGNTIIIDPGPNDTLLVDGTTADGASFSHSYNLFSYIADYDRYGATPPSSYTDAHTLPDTSWDCALNTHAGTIDAGDGNLAPSAPDGFVQGGGGDTNYTLAAGDGSVTVDNYSAGNPGTLGTVSFDGTVASTAVAVSADAAGDVLLNNTVTGSTVKVVSALSDPNYAIKGVAFADGTTLTLAQLASLAATASPSNTSIYGFSGHDTLDSKGYAYAAQGKGGGDTFVYDRGYGSLQITEATDAAVPGAVNTLSFGPGITPHDLSALNSQGGYADLVLSDGLAGDQIVLQNMLSGPGFGVQKAVFADGTTWTWQQLAALASTATPGADVLRGTGGADTLDGQGAPAGSQDYEEGNGGADTFVFKQGYGQLEIYESEASPAATAATLQLGAGITAGQVAITSDSLGNVVLTDGTTGDRVQVDGMMNLSSSGQPSFGVAQVAFADGTVWTRQQVVDRATTGTAAADTLYGTAAADTFDGKGAPAGSQDYEQGNGGADTFVYQAGYGQLEIYESQGYSATTPSTAMLRLGAGITANQVVVQADAQGSLILTDGTAGDRVQIDSMMDLSSSGQPSSGVAQVAFADGTAWTYSQIVAFADAGTSGADYLYGTAAADTFDGKGAPAGSQDYEQGNGGADTFVYQAGYGQLEISEAQGYYNAAEIVLQFGAGIGAAQVGVTSDASGNVFLTDGTTGDRVQVDGLLSLKGPGSAGGGAAQAIFADGTIWTSQQIVDMATTGTSRADYLYGTSAADTFDGKGAPAGSQDYEQGNGGTDTFVYQAGYGHLEIFEDQGYSTKIPSTATLQLGAGITAAQASVTSDTSGNIILTDGVSGDRVQVDSMLNGNGYGAAAYGVAQIVFADGTAWSAAQVLAMETTGTPGNDTLYGMSGPDLFDGKGGQDLEVGKGGADTFVFNPGYGRLEINEDAGYDDASTATLQLGAGISTANVSVAGNRDGSVLLTDGVAGDQVKIDGMLAPANGSYPEYGVAQVVFADGTTLSRQQLSTLAATGTAGADTLYGTAGTDTLDGKGAPGGSQDYVQGNGGADTFVFNPGYGQLEVNEDAGDYTNSTATLQLGAGIAAAAVSVTGNQDGSVLLTDGVANDQVKIDRMLTANWTGYTQYGMAQLQFADGTTWSRAQLVALAGMGTAGSDTISGTSGNDVLDGRGGGDTISGGGGYDTYLMRQGYGTLTIDNSVPGGAAAQGEADFGPGITEQNLWFSQSGDDLVASVMGSADAVDVKGWFGTNPSAQLAGFKAFDGLRLDGQMGQLTEAMAAYAASTPGFDPATATAMPADPTLRSALAAAWHS